MLSCKINGCETTSSNKDRSIFEVKGEDRKKWIDEIKTHQELDTTRAVFICDLHFKPSDLTKNGKSFRPKKNVLPELSNIKRIPDVSISNLRNGSIDEVADGNFHNCSQPEEDSKCEMTSISLEQYRKILNSTVELYRAKEYIEKLEKITQKKDDEIECLKTQLKAANTVNEKLTQEQNEVLNTFINGFNGSRIKYMPGLRKFCIRMLFHSRAAYNELRQFFNNNIPSQRTMQRWLQCIDGSPGITKMALDAIKNKVQEYKHENKRLHICMIHDEMSMKQHVSWNENDNTFMGFCTETNASDEGEKLSVAKDVLVYMAVGPDFRIAVAYFLLNGLQSIDRAALTKEVILAVENTGAIVLSLTGDGLAANILSYELLGTDFKLDKPYFASPKNSERKIYVIFDPPHMLKLVRKDFSTRKLYHKDQLLNWDLLAKLAAKQDSDNFALGNKLTLRRHITWHLSPMTVRYAAETMSNSVADVLEQLCQDGYGGFENCESTVELIRLCNNLFDLLNCGEGKKANNQFKQPLSEASYPAFLQLFEKFREFVNDISVEITNKKGKSLKNIKSFFLKRSNKFIGFFGFLQNIISVIGIYIDYFRGHDDLDTFYTFQFSQDNLETYFSLIRSSLGCNTNPNAQQFMAAYRKLLICMPHMSSKHTNCNYFHVSNILTVSSTQTPSIPSHIEINSTKGIEVDTDYQTLIESDKDPYERHICAYVSSIVEAKVLQKMKAQTVSACQDCLSIFNENNKIYDNFIAKKINSGEELAQPCCSTRDIIVVCESICKILQEKKHLDFKIVSKTIWNCLDVGELYPSTLFESHAGSTSNNPTHEEMSISNTLSHKETFLYSIVLEYMRIKSKNIGRRITDEEWAESMKKRKARRMKIVTGR